MLVINTLLHCAGTWCLPSGGVHRGHRGIHNESGQRTAAHASVDQVDICGRARHRRRPGNPNAYIQSTMGGVHIMLEQPTPETYAIIQLQHKVAANEPKNVNGILLFRCALLCPQPSTRPRMLTRTHDARTPQPLPNHRNLPVCN